jgi:Glycosyl hydrolases family 28
MNQSRRAFLRHSVGALAAPCFLSRGRHAAAAPAPPVARPKLSVRAYGAKGDGQASDTRAIQLALDAAGRSRGIVYFPPGRYLSGTLRLRSHITLQLDAGASLVASRNDTDFDPIEDLGYDSFADPETSSFRFALLQGRGLEQVGILGPGRIDGNRTTRDGPKPIALKECRNVKIRDVTIVNAGSYNISLLGCDGVEIVGVTILNGYSDGIDPDCCQNVRIAHCHVDSRDDAIVLKASYALGARRATRNVTVTNCYLTTIHNALKLGTESTGDFTNIVFSNCTIVGRRHAWKGDLSAGVAIETVDGGRLEHVSVSDIRMTNVRAPLFIRLAQRGRAQATPAAGQLRNISISNLVAVGALTASSITGIPGHLVSNISLKNIRITARGGGAAELVERVVPELEKTYPDAYMFGDLPAYGLYCRHVDGLRLDGVDLNADQADARPAVVLDDVSRAVIRAMQAVPPAEGAPLVWLRSVRECRLEGLRPRAGTRILMRLSGADTAGIRVVRSDLRQVKKMAIVDTGAAVTALRVEGSAMPAAAEIADAVGKNRGGGLRWD